ncbi:hypothetical protein FE257_005576 [Aspergillus nanangensis]|uniref:Uncharacterized protein n=1 Tax=Aspergillus nanangensis TaxID=2582783 RepID=A0AAD4GVJ0_ASPNN|nr:hypothetical protein FE257_005576 [Aspergillus nanangensis]
MAVEDLSPSSTGGTRHMHRAPPLNNQGDQNDIKAGYFVTVGVGAPQRLATETDSSLMRGDTHKAAVEKLKCERCEGHRSPSYHRKHREDAVQHPAHGICARRRTGCARARQAPQRGPSLQPTVEITASEWVRGQGITSGSPRIQPTSSALIPVYELPGMPISSVDGK